MKLFKIVIVIILFLSILSACKSTCNCPAYSMSPPQNPVQQEAR